MTGKSCFNCGYRQLDTTKCPLIGYSYPNDETAAPVCPYWVDELNTCGVCGQIIAGQALRIFESADGTFKLLCDRCKNASGTCLACVKNADCDFETNPSPIPKAVEKRFQQGPMIRVEQVPNPERIDSTCRINCECFSEEFGCLRQNGTCGKYEGVF